MRHIGIILVFAACFGITSISAQDTELEKSSGDFTEAFQTALNKQSITAFIKDNSLPDSELQVIVDTQNEDMGFSEKDPGRVTVEQARTYMREMKRNLAQSFHYGLQALKNIDNINPDELIIQDYRVQKSYWQPPVAEIAMRVSARENELTISMSNLGIVDGRPVLGPSSRLQFMGYEPHNVIAHYIIEALKQQSANYYADMVFPGLQGFKALIEAGPETQVSTETSAEELYMHAKKRVVDDFTKLIETGAAKGIKWSDIKKTWSGYSASLQGQLYQASIPIQFNSGNSEYRIVLDYCQQLATDTSVFLPGEFKWEGKIE